MVFFFCVALQLSFVEEEENWMNNYGSLIYVLFILIFIFLKLKWLRKKDAPNWKFHLLSTWIPLLYIPFIVCWCYLDFGYGNTLGILGYNRKLGFLSAMHIPYSTCFFLFLVSFVVLLFFLIIRFRYYIIFKNLQGKTKKTAQFFLNCLKAGTCIIFYCSLLDYMSDNFLSRRMISLYFLISAIYWSVNCLITAVLRVKEYMIYS